MTLVFGCEASTTMASVLGRTFAMDGFREHQVTQPFPVALLCIGTWIRPNFTPKKNGPNPEKGAAEIDLLDYYGYATFWRT